MGRIRGRYYSTSVSVDVDVDVKDVLSHLDKNDLQEILADMKIDMGVPFAHVEWAYDALRRGDVADALLVLERLVRPKWGTLAAAEAAYEKARAA